MYILLLHRTLVLVLVDSTRPRRDVGQGPHGLVGWHRSGQKRRIDNFDSPIILRLLEGEDFFLIAQNMNFFSILMIRNGRLMEYKYYSLKKAGWSL